MNKKLDEAIIEHFKWYFKKGYITHRDGNAAYRTKGGYVVTGSGVIKNDIKRTDFVLVDKNCKMIDSYGKKPSIEGAAHVAALEQSGKNASVHVHSPNTVALAALYDNTTSNGNQFKPRSYHLEKVLNSQYPELFRYTKVAPIPPYFEPGSKKLHDSIVSCLGYWTEKFIGDPHDPDIEEVKKFKDIIILQRHGVLAIGDSLDECMEHIIRLEHISTILLKIVTASGSLESIL